MRKMLVDDFLDNNPLDDDEEEEDDTYAMWN